MKKRYKIVFFKKLVLAHKTGEPMLFKSREEAEQVITANFDEYLADSEVVEA